MGDRHAGERSGTSRGARGIGGRGGFEGGVAGHGDERVQCRLRGGDALQVGAGELDARVLARGESARERGNTGGRRAHSITLGTR